MQTPIQEWNDDNVCSTFMLSLKSPLTSIHNDLIHPNNLLIDKWPHVATRKMFKSKLLCLSNAGGAML